MTQAAANIPRMGYSAAEAADALGVGRSLLLQMDKAGRLGPQFHRLGTRRILCVDELRAWAVHGMPPRSRWLTIWAQIVEKTEGFAQTGIHGIAGSENMGASLRCMGNEGGHE